MRAAIAITSMYVLGFGMVLLDDWLMRRRRAKKL